MGNSMEWGHEMKEFYHIARQIISGRRVIDNRIKYRVIGAAIAFVHLIFTIAFYSMQIMPLYFYNMAVTLFYTCLSVVAVNRESYVSMYISAAVEILFHSSMASILLGWDWGFMLYTITLIPVAFYLTYTLPQFNRKVSVPAVVSIIVSVTFVLIRAVCAKIEPMYTGTVPENAHTSFYIANSIIALDMQIIFSILFALEIRYMQYQLEKENRMLGKIANYDPLTHLLNRRSMSGHMKDAYALAETEEQPFCLVLADIDNFKRFNDTYGHDCGDEVLIMVADTISGNVREDDYVCRWGGEEILALLRADLDTAGRIAGRICGDIASKVLQYKDADVNVTVTMGVSEYREGKTIRSMIEEADENLYKGKRNGKNQVVCSKNE